MYNKIKALAVRRRGADASTIKEIDREMLRLEEENPEEYRVALERLIKESSDRIDEITLSEKLGDVAKIISMSYVAREYFGKSRSWLSHRLNGDTVNGKPCRLNKEQMQEFKKALADIANKIGSISETL